MKSEIHQLKCEAQYSSPALIRPPLMQRKSGLKQRMASLEGDNLVD